jgi:hypothetical protein
MEIAFHGVSYAVDEHRMAFTAEYIELSCFLSILSSSRATALIAKWCCNSLSTRIGVDNSGSFKERDRRDRRHDSRLATAAVLLSASSQLPASHNRGQSTSSASSITFVYTTIVETSDNVRVSPQRYKTYPNRLTVKPISQSPNERDIIKIIVQNSNESIKMLGFLL